MNGFIIYYNAWEKGTCIDFQIAWTLLDAICLFKRVRPHVKISFIKII
jgi:hypothetical protein